MPTQLLGRAENLKDYIQRGQSEAWTEITLSGGPGKADIVVRRDIKQTKREETSGYSSKWRLNGEKSDPHIAQFDLSGFAALYP